jgi:hypothetical protein
LGHNGPVTFLLFLTFFFFFFHFFAIWNNSNLNYMYLK